MTTCKVNFMSNFQTILSYVLQRILLLVVCSKLVTNFRSVLRAIIAILRQEFSAKIFEAK